MFQHFSLFDALTVLENIALGMDAKIPQRELETKIREVMTRYGLKLEPSRSQTADGAPGPTCLKRVERSSSNGATPPLGWLISR